MIVKLLKKESVSKDIFSFYFSKPKNYDYQSGQYIQLYLPHKNVDSRGDKRWFTLSSSPTEEHLSITTRYSAAAASSFKKALLNIPLDSEVTINESMGDFVLPQDDNIELLFIAGGLGITPVRSILKYLLDTKEKRNISIIYSVKSIESAIFSDIIATYGARLDIVLSEKAPRHSGRIGKVNFEIINELNVNLSEKLIYISGPEPFVESVQTQLLDNGVDNSKLVLDFYPGYEY